MFLICSRLRLNSLGLISQVSYHRSISRHGFRRNLTTKRPDNPIALELYKSTYGIKNDRRVPKGDKSRINIVSEALCGIYQLDFCPTNLLMTKDDVLNRLAASLKKHTHCDIIDINPGASLWSSKLHDALKPRTHILMEPDKDRYLPFIQPLLDQKGSTYKFIPEAGIFWDNLNKLETNKMLPNQTLLSSGDSRLEMPNDTLLMIANLGYYPSKSYNGFSSITALMIHQLLTAIRAHSIFQGYGLVRMLIWMRDPDKNIVLPRTIPSRRKFSVEAEISCENIFEIAGSDESSLSTRREHSIDLQSSSIVRDKMASARIKTPENRIGSLQAEVEDGYDMSTDTSSGAFRPFQIEYNELVERFARKEFCAYYDEDGKPVYSKTNKFSPKFDKQKLTPEWKKMLYLKYRANKEDQMSARTDHVLREYDEIMESYKTLEQNSPSADAEKAIQDRFSAWQDDLEGLPRVIHSLASQRIDDRRSFRQDPPVLLWDRRATEPLIVHEEEFFPQNEMCLLDFQPKSIWPIFQGTNVSNYDYFEFMLASLFMFPTQPLTRGLAALAPGAAEWIIPRCPSLTNIAKGGAADVSALAVRTLNQEMFHELIQAWMDWPFRPSKASMLARMGSQNVFDSDSEPVDGMGSFSA